MDTSRDNSKPSQLTFEESASSGSAPLFMSEIEALELRASKIKKIGWITSGLTLACCVVAVIAAVASGVLGPDASLSSIDVPQSVLDQFPERSAFTSISAGNDSYNPVSGPLESLTTAMTEKMKFIGPLLSAVCVLFAIVRQSIAPIMLAVMMGFTPFIMSAFTESTGNRSTSSGAVAEESPRKIFENAIDDLDYKKIEKMSVSPNQQSMATRYLVAQISAAIALRDVDKGDAAVNRDRAKSDIANLFAVDNGAFKDLTAKPQILYALDSFAHDKVVSPIAQAYEIDRLATVAAADTVRKLSTSTTWSVAGMATLLMAAAGFLGARVRRIKYLLEPGSFVDSPRKMSKRFIPIK
ncbi:hypothetical protein [Pseudomonas sp. RIT-PI-o]|uniref:hypothetical protein n=1 Tax=Pseudomonas sp. RIT-PI-o TaxID=1690246 RepID=UPI000A72A03D|nr:hypothetical protein [Pseudomonas sp. RIT-PI-o]